MKIFFIAALILFFFSCTKDHEQVLLVKPPGCDSILFTYENNVRPLIATNCSGPTCHSGGNSNYDYSSYDVIVSRIRAGVFEERLLLPEGDPLYMPQDRELGRCDLFTLRMWIHQGFKK